MRYKWRNPKNKLEEIEVFTLVEDRDDKVLVRSNYTESAFAITPTYCYYKRDLIEI